MRDLAQLSNKDLSLVLSLLSASHHTTPIINLLHMCHHAYTATVEVLRHRSELVSIRRVRVATCQFPVR
jgi:hypothetical protein